MENNENYWKINEKFKNNNENKEKMKYNEKNETQIKRRNQIMKNKEE